MAQPSAAPGAGVARYMPSLDGLRGICMLAVLIGHLTIFGGAGLLFQPQMVNLLGGGELALEVFFVLSGALITHIALSEISKTGTLDLRKFRNRRIRRLAPAAAIALLATIVLCVTGLRDDQVPLGTESTLVVFSVLALSSNWLLFSRANLGYLTPTWSLSVEEQFYLGWPVTLRRTWNRLGAAGAALAALALLVAGLGVSILLTSHLVYATYATPVAGVALLCGCLMAIGLHSPWAPALRRFVGSTPVAVVLALGIGFGARWLHFHIEGALRGGYLLFEIATALFIGHLMVRSDRPSAFSRVLGLRPLVHLGRISYGAYLFHATIYQMWDHAGLLPNVVVRGIVDVTSTLVIATVIFKYVEEPIRLGRLRLPRRTRSERSAPRPRPAGAWARVRFVPQIALGLAAIAVVLQFAPAVQPLVAAKHKAHSAASGTAHRLSADRTLGFDTGEAEGPASRSRHSLQKARAHESTSATDDGPATTAAGLTSAPPSPASRTHAPGVVASPVMTRGGQRWVALFHPVTTGTTDGSSQMAILQWRDDRWAVVDVVDGIPAFAAGTTYRISIATVSGTGRAMWVLQATCSGTTSIAVVSHRGGRWHLINVNRLSAADLLAALDDPARA